MRNSLPGALVLLWIAALGGCSDGHNRSPGSGAGPVEPGPVASARQVSGDNDLLQGPLARGRTGDYVLENDLIRVIIQGPGREWLGLGTYGGNIIDAAARQPDGSFLPDHLEEFLIGINVENTAHYTEVRVDSDGSDGGAAVVCASGPDDLVEYVNASTAVRGFGFSYPAEADDRDLPLEVETCYSLAPGDRFVLVESTLRNTGGSELPLYLLEYVNSSGQVEPFQTLAGFGLPQVTTGCPTDTWAACSSGEEGRCDPCNMLAHAGTGEARGVSYGLFYEQSGSSSFSTAGVTLVVIGQNVIDILAGQQPPAFSIAAGETLSLRRYFAVGSGTIASLADIRNELFGYETGTVAGTVRSAGEPVDGAQVAVYQVRNPNTDPPTLFVAGHSRTDGEGRYQMSLPPGEYLVRANKSGYLFDPDDPRELFLAAEQSVEQDFDLPVPGQLRVTVLDQTGPVPAKLQLVGFDPSPRLQNSVVLSDTGVFEDVSGDPLPYGISLVAFIGPEGDSGVLTVEPGDYQLVLSRGPRYAAYKELVTIESGKTTEIQAELLEVVPTPGFISGDFHVHGIDSVDARVTREERVAIYLAEGIDFFSPSDHDIRVDYSGTLSSMGVEHLLGTAPNSEITTFDYGHFNSWPVTVDPGQLNGGTIDWGRAAQPGMDFPEYGSYNFSPGEIQQGLKDDPKDNLVQINHVASYFGGGLEIDTALVPPRSQVDLSLRRLDPSLGNAFDENFDALELWIGTNGIRAITGEFLGRNAGDWFNLINQGMVRAGVANSDSHDGRHRLISARTLIPSEETDPGELSPLAEQLAASVMAGRAIATNGPFLTVQASGLFQGSEGVAGLAIEHGTTLPVDAGGSVDLDVVVSTPAWALVDRLEFYINNQPYRSSAPGQAPRYGICPDVVIRQGDAAWASEDVVVDDSIDGAWRRDVRATLTLDSIQQDTWVVVIASGTEGISEPLFPVLPASLDEESNSTLADLIDGNLGEGGTPAFAFTNPLFIDAGGDGWQPPGINLREGDCPAD